MAGSDVCCVSIHGFHKLNSDFFRTIFYFKTLTYRLDYTIYIYYRVTVD